MADGRLLCKASIFRRCPRRRGRPRFSHSEGPIHHCRSGGVHRRAVGACLLLVWLFAPTASWAYRPFISTDAAVADPKEVEIEFGYFTLEREKGENSFIIPRVVINYGVFKNWEAVAEFAVRWSPDAEVNVIDPALFIKGVLKEGFLQNKEGIGIAVEPWSSKNLWFDTGIRRGFTSGVPDWQFTLGITFGFSVSSLWRSASSLGDFYRASGTGGVR